MFPLICGPARQGSAGSGIAIPSFTIITAGVGASMTPYMRTALSDREAAVILVA